jgi:hypothetical protein
VDLSTVAEGGTFAHNGTTQLIITTLRAFNGVSFYDFVSASDGRWYYAWRMKNGNGWSPWTDGNTNPTLVSDYADTNDLIDTGPPNDWEVTVTPGAVADTYIASASRPRTNGKTILFFWAQFKDADTGSWRELDANAGAAVTYYDGSGSDHVFDPATGQITNGGAGWGTASVGDLVLIDVRGDGNFAVDYTTWAMVEVIGTPLTIGAWSRLQVGASMSGLTYDKVRIKIVKPPWAWTTEGYLGATPGYGLWNENSPGNNWVYGNISSTSFTTGPVQVPSTVTNVQCRVWFENWYSRSSGNPLISSSNLLGDTSDFIEGPYTWATFSDRNWWIPVIQGSNVVLTLNSNGSVKGGVGASTASGSVYGTVGVGSRFRLYPSRTEGEIVFRGKWTVSVNRADSARSGMGVSILIWLPGQGQLSSGYDINMPSITAQEVPDGSNQTTLRIGLSDQAGSVVTWDPPTPVAACTATIANASMPSNPFTIELRCTMAKDASEKLMVISLCEYQINGGGWVTVSQSSLVRRLGAIGIVGLRVLPVYQQLSNGAGNYATLTEFELTKGIAVRY